MNENNIDYHGIFLNNNIYSIMFFRCNNAMLLLGLDKIPPLNIQEQTTTVGPMVEFNNQMSTKNLVKLKDKLKDKPILRIFISGDGGAKDIPIHGTAFDANTPAFLMSLTEHKFEAVFIENVTCSRSGKIYDNKSQKYVDILDPFKDLGIEKIYYGHVLDGQEQTSEAEQIELYKLNKNTEELKFQKLYNICIHDECGQVKEYNTKGINDFYNDLSNDINIAKIKNYQETFQELKQMTKDEQVKYIKLIKKITTKSNTDTTRETIELLDLIGKNLKNNPPVNKLESKSKENSK